MLNHTHRSLHVVGRWAFVCSMACLVGSGASFAQPSAADKAPGGSAKRVLIYSGQISQVSTKTRGWPTVRILRKSGNAEPEILAEVGKVDEYPGGYSLSPDKKHLLINLETKLQTLNLMTRRLEDMFVPVRQVLGMAHSPDGAQVLIWDQKYAPQDRIHSYYIHRLEIATGRSELLKQGTNDYEFFIEAWRRDGKLVLRENHLSYSIPYYFDLKDGSLAKTPGQYRTGVVGANGKVMAVVANLASDPCEDMDGQSPDAYSIIEPVSGITLGSVVAKGKRVQVLAFSQDGNEFLYTTEDIPADDSACAKIPRTSYFRGRLGSRQATRIAGPLALPRGWNDFYFGAIDRQDHANRTWQIDVAGHPVIISKNPLRLIAQYYE